MRNVSVALAVILLSGCGGGRTTVVEHDPAQDSLESLNECLGEAYESVRAITAPEALDDESSASDPVAPVSATMQTVVVAAQEAVKASAGTPIESEVKAILTAAQDLQTKAASPSAAKEIEQGLLQVRSKVNELRMRRSDGR